MPRYSLSVWEPTERTTERPVAEGSKACRALVEARPFRSEEYVAALLVS